MKRESKNNDYLFDAIITMIITFVGPESSAGALTSAEPCQHTAANELVPVFAEHLGLFHEDRLLQTHNTSAKNGKLNTCCRLGSRSSRSGMGRGGLLHGTAGLSAELPWSPWLVRRGSGLQRAELPSGGTHLSPFISSLVFVSFSPSLSAQNGTAVISGTKHRRDKVRACQCSSLGEKNTQLSDQKGLSLDTQEPEITKLKAALATGLKRLCSKGY